ncbi:TIGR04222 domain-containing membrane protein [Streptomyces zaehneri]|uniref:TIGR04222 domain-containing membrane protein n=1 Tax=Streptomyces zaehneri TaxID=3051180 RepID=UPI0028D304C9|nr:TIGR04222 domain-containing membrane protein [Streptomyces sp. DSM 40713]
MSGGTPVRLEPYEVALLRGGPRAAVTVAALALRLRGLVDAGRPGRIRATKTTRAPGATGAPSAGDAEGGRPAQDALDALPALDDLPEAVYAALQRPASLAELEALPDVREALSGLRAGLVAAGMLRSLPPRRTRAARRALRTLRDGRPLPADRKGLSTDDVLMAVALYGEPALNVLAARFALRAGLVARAEVADKGFHRRSPRGGGTGGVMYSCGGGGGGGGGSD